MTTIAPTKASDYLAAFLAAQGVPCVFEMSGGMITFLLDALHRRGATRIVSMHHEQGAAFAAEGIGRMTGVPGVAMATSGPGATNLLTGIGSCHFDSSPAVFITGQVNRHEQKGASGVRQLGFQETDIVNMARPITKAAWMVEDSADLPAALTRAFAIAVEGRPGPVLLDIPMDVQRGPVDAPLPGPIRLEPVGQENPEFYDDLFTHLARAERPLVLLGGGVRSGRAAGLAREFVDRLGVPAVHSLMAVDVLAHDDPRRVGMIGSYGNRWANLALGASDFLLVLGSRLDVRQTGADPNGFRKGKSIFQVDADASEMNNRVTDCRTHHRQLDAFFRQALTHPCLTQAVPRPGWPAEIARLRARWPDTGEQLPHTPGINPNAFMHALSGTRAARGALAYVVDVGQHQMWAAQSLELYGDQRFLTSGGMGSMGFSLPAAVGASLADGGKRPVVVVAGDGCFQANIQELQTVRRNGLPLKMVVVNNGCHGMVRQFQEAYFDGRYQSTYWGYSAPDFEAVARAYGMDARTVADPAEVPAAVDWLWADPACPALLQVMVDMTANAYPKMAFGRGITEMEPFAKPLDMEGT